jgi:hypothetical protein
VHLTVLSAESKEFLDSSDAQGFSIRAKFQQNSILIVAAVLQIGLTSFFFGWDREWEFAT